MQGANKHRLKQLLADSGVTAVFAVNFVVATFLLRDLWACGLRLPQDVSLVGFGLDQPSPYSPFPFTAARQSGFQAGQIGARLLLERIEGRLAPEPQHIVVPTVLVVNSSSGLTAVSPPFP